MSTPIPPSIPFVNLHTHTQFSLLEASSRTKDLVAVAKEAGMPALAITDSGNLYGAVEFYTACKDAGIKPIIGCELAVVEGDITDRNTRKPSNTVVLLCQNQTGYRNLCQLVSTAHMDGFYFRPRINWELLEKHNEGLICLTDNLYGPIGYHILRGHYELASDRVKWLKGVFGDRLFLEMQYHGLGPEVQVCAAVTKLSQELDVPVVITNDSRFTRPGQEKALEILLCMQQGKTINEPRTKNYGPEFYLKTGQQLADTFAHMDKKLVAQALANTLKVADMVDFHWPMGESILPAFPLPVDEQGHQPTEAQYLETLVERYTLQKYADADGVLPDEVRQRMVHELKVINEMGFPAYFLIVWDFIDYARQQGIPVGPGRGSAAGSLVAFVLGITNIDPIEHNLLFERFLNPERISMPDIDIDFCIERRGDVIDYVSQRYGRERVCQIATFGTLAAKAAVKAVARVLDIPYAESDRVAKMIPGIPGTKLKDALAKGTELQKEYDGNPQVKDWVDIALLLEGTACNVGTHAAGVVISKDPLTEVIALQNSKDGQVISQCTMGDLEKLGLLKMDFLGLRNLTIIRNAINLITKYHDVTLDMDTTPLDDEKVYELLTSGDTDGVFQLESSGMKALVRDLKPSGFEDINALVALYRPGPLNSGMVKTFVDRKHGREKVAYPNDALIPILKPTYGTIVYQEQIMQVAQILGGYSLGQADLLRRAMGKKKAEIMEKERANFIAGCQATGLIEDDPANALFDTMTEFAAYCFNRSHSAAYALVAYQTAWLKAHYPVEYLSALLSSVRDSLDKIQHYIMCGRRMGIKVLPPDVNESDLDFTPSTSQGGQAIRFGLASIKNVGVGVVDCILKARTEGGVFVSLEDFLKRVELKVLNRKTLESLVASGALDTFGHSRKQLTHNIDTMTRFAEQQLEQAETGQASLFDLLGAGDSGGNFGGLMLSGDPTDEFPQDDLQRDEKALLGFYVSSHPLDGVADLLPLVTQYTLAQLKALPNDSEVLVGGLVSSCGRRMSKKNKPLLIGVLEDLSSSAEFLAFGEAVEQYHTILAEGQRVVMKAKVSFRGEDEETFTLIVNQVKPLALVEPLVLALDQPPNFQQVHYVGEVLKQHRGESPVIFALPDGTRIKAGPAFWVDNSHSVRIRGLIDEALKAPVGVGG
jgi:DNA polymerase III subunit alpha